MRSLLEHLDSPDAVLLMYLADELPAEDRTRVERMLADDAALRGEFERLRAAQESIDGALAGADTARPLPGSEAAGVRQVGRMIRNWQVERLTRSAGARDAHAPRNLRFPYWSYPLAAAAAVTLAFVAWYVNLPEPGKMAAMDAPAGLATADSSTPDGSLAVGPDDVNPALVNPGDAVQFASIVALSDASGLPEVETELRQVQSLRELMQ
jgi:anti-sigma factor RsiW